MFASVVLRLRPLATVNLPANLGPAIRGAFFDLVKRFDPALATRLHPAKGQRELIRYTTSPLQGPMDFVNGRVQLQAGSNYWLRFTSTDAALSELLTTLDIKSISTLDLLELPCTVVRVAITPRQSSWARSTDATALYRKWMVERKSVSNAVSFEFMSPTTFRHGAVNAPFPVPRLLFLSLARKWNACTPINLGNAINEAIDDFLELTRYDLRTHSLAFDKSREFGFVGWARYRLRPRTKDGDLLMRITHLLVDFSFYAGVGAKTSMGMGQARRLWKPKNRLPS